MNSPQTYEMELVVHCIWSTECRQGFGYWKQWYSTVDSLDIIQNSVLGSLPLLLKFVFCYTNGTVLTARNTIDRPGDHKSFWDCYKICITGKTLKLRQKSMIYSGINGQADNTE